jgi:hypothetical protein
VVELVKVGRTPEELGKEFEPTAQTIIKWWAVPPGGYGFMMANQARWPVATMARLLVVSASGYYVWPAREPWKRACSDAVARVHPLTAHVRFLDPLLRNSAAKVCLDVAGTFGWSRNPRAQACRLRATMLRWRCCSS